VKYVQGNSPLHLLDARVKIAGLAFLLLGALLLPLEESWLLLVLLFALYWLSGISLLWATAKNRLLLLFALVPFLVRVFFIGGVYAGAMNFIYIYFICFSSLLFIYSTRTHEIADALLFWSFPKKLVLMLSIALRYLPFLQRKLGHVRMAQEVRGGGDFFSLAVPLFHFVFLQARKMAVALEVRGFGAE